MDVNSILAQLSESPINLQSVWLRRKSPLSVPLLDVSLASPGYPPALELRQFLASEVLRDNAATYTEVEGLLMLREAVAAKTSKLYNSSVDPREVTITSGCSEAFAVATMSIAERGDEILLPVPYYFGHDMWLRAAGIRPVYVTLESDASFEGLERRLRAYLSSRTRALVLVTPNNPTGENYSPALIEHCFHFCQEYGIALILDETYRDLRVDHTAPHGLFSKPRWRDVLIQLCSYSKVYSLTGYRIGSIVCGDPVREQIIKLLEAITICPARLSQLAAWFGLQFLDGWCHERALEIEKLRNEFGELMRRASTGFDVVSYGTCFAYVRHPFKNLDSRTVSKAMLEEQNVLTVPGGVFGSGQEAFLRVSFANLASKQLSDLVSRMKLFEERTGLPMTSKSSMTMSRSPSETAAVD